MMKKDSKSQIKRLLLLGVFCFSSSSLADDQITAPNQWQLAGYNESSVAISEHPAYRPLKKALVNYATPEILETLSSRFPDIEFVSTTEVGEITNDFDALFSRCGRSTIFSQVSNIAWFHSYSAGVDACMRSAEFNQLVDREKSLVLSNSSGTAAAVIAEHSIAMMMSLARGLHRYRDLQSESNWSRSTSSEPNLMQTVNGKTMLVLGLGSIGQEVAKRADALGMRVIATRNSSRTGPEYVEYVGLSDETIDLASKADVIVNALPLTDSTDGFIGQDFFAAMQPNSYYISVGRGGTTDTNALMLALKNKKIAGAGLDVTDPEPLPSDHPLWDLDNVIISPHISGTGGEGREKVITLLMENIRRYQAGEPLLNIVDTHQGY